MSDLLNRVRRRAGRELRELLPHHEHFRPSGVHASSQQLACQPTASVAYFGLVPAHRSYSHVPDDFYARASRHRGLHVKPHREEAVPEAFVVMLPRGRIYADNYNSVAVIAADNCLVGDVSFQYDGALWDLVAPEQNNIFRQRYFVPPRQIAGTVCSLLAGGGAAMGNYYHWLIDSLPRLHLVREAGLLDSVDFFLVYDKRKGFVCETLAALGIGPERILDIATYPHYQAQQLVATSPVRGRLTHTPEWAGHFLQSIFLPPPLVDRCFSPFVYLSRNDAPNRRVLNEAALEPMLAEYGFQTHVLTPYSQDERVALFAQARVVVSAVSAGLSNLVFCAPGTQVLELLPQTFVVPDYLELSTRLGLRHQYLVCPTPRQQKHRYAAQREDLMVPEAALRRRLDALMQPEPLVQGP
ncbi:glycosyltransferase family 61 protein [Hymenobacter lapidiphilus]|uniref:Glycosyltransferase family 61 protein n=1 Tax=Hymenobacter lapidiphilus TaxID=2608003 RepID=A0A7Y7U6I6_9BACT|nr:glycosyltransferase family 61 protein [Hymenobacter lapidiphilus]NVO32563.1 glycosyltransferase family 61 protein [Hymenobacter lapidiphilus]